MNVKKAVIPAAGFGTRFLPATKSQPKEMLSLVDKPLIQYSVEEAVQSGIKKIGIIVSRGKEAIPDHFDESPELESFLEVKGKKDELEEVKRIGNLADFCFIRQRQALGLGHAVLVAEDFIGQEPFAVLLPDDIFDCPVPCIKQLLEVAQEKKATVIVLMPVGKEGTEKYGIIKPGQISDRLYEIKGLMEKPGPEKAFSDLAVIGRYVFTPEIFDAIRETPPDHRGEIQITDAINLLLKEQPVYGLVFEGRRYDAGDKFGFLEATVELALKRLEFKERFRHFLKNI
ncbi:MAG: UTP--glucose-1-phosphate uridylyltransferase GalU [Acidobacteriota bacterium]